MQRLLIPILLITILISGCDDVVDPPVELAVRVQVLDRDSGQRQSGVKIVLMDPAVNRVVAGPRLSDESGFLTFSGLEAGVYRVLVFPGQERGVFSHPGEFRLGGSGPVGKNAPDPIYEIITWHDEIRFADKLPRFSGTVVDATTGDPLSAVFIGFASTMDLYTGYYSVSVDVSNSDGAFHVANIPVTPDEFSGNLTQVVALMVHCEGYEPRAWRHHFANGDNNLDVLGTRIELNRIGTIRGLGALSGKLIFRDTPVADIEVGLAYFDDPDNPFFPADDFEKSGVGQPGLMTVTDADGRFLLQDIPEGQYLLHPAYRSGDGYMRSYSVSSKITVIADSTIVMDPLPILSTIEPIWPRPGCTVRDSLPLWRWSTAAEVDSFRVYLDRCFLGTTTVPQLEMPEFCVLSDGNSLFNVIGFADGGIVAEIESHLEFRVVLEGE